MICLWLFYPSTSLNNEHAAGKWGVNAVKGGTDGGAGGGEA